MMTDSSSSLFSTIVAKCAATHGITAVELGCPERIHYDALIKKKRCKKWRTIRLPHNFDAMIGSSQLTALANKMLDFSRDGEIFWEVTTSRTSSSNELVFWS
jgi:hypothetical protein